MKHFMLTLALCLSLSTLTFADGGVVGVEPALDAKGRTIPEELDGFEYEITGEETYIQEYEGNQKVITINSSYDIDGNTYRTNLTEYEASIGRDVEAVIFGEGIKTIAHANF